MDYISSKAKLSEYRLYLVLILIIFPLWSFINQSYIDTPPEYQDTYFLRFLFVSPAMLFLIGSFFYHWIRKNISWLFTITCLSMHLGHGLIVSSSRFNHTTVSGQILIMLLVNVHLENIKQFIFFNTFALLVVIYPSHHHIDVSRFVYFTELLTISLVTAFVLQRRLKLLKQINHSQQELEKEKVKSFQIQKQSSLGILAAGIAHEINNPLMTLNLYCRKMYSIGGKTSELKEIADKHNKQIARIASIIASLKTYSKDGSKDAKKEVSLLHLVQESLNVCYYKSNPLGVQFDIKVPKEKVINVKIIESEQVIINIIHNAIDAISNINNKHIQIHYEEDHQFKKLHIKDSGNGVPADIKNKIFDPFYTTKKLGDGTGLGLSFSREIMESQGGKLELDSTHSNIFTISFKKDS